MNEKDTNTQTQAVARVASEAFMLFDRADDAQVIARIRGAALREYVYGFKQGGQMIYGLGADGADACKRELAILRGEVIDEAECTIESQDVEHAIFKAKAIRWAVNQTGEKRIQLDSALEMKRQAKFTTRRDGSQEPNQFWVEQGSSKAIRNAILKLIPEEIKQKVILAYKDQAKVVDAAPGSDVNEAMGHEYHQAFRDKDERDGLVAEVRELWRGAGMTVAGVKATLKGAGLSEALAQQNADWSTVSLASIADLRNAMKKAVAK